jgi:hypothetical protein
MISNMNARLEELKKEIDSRYLSQNGIPEDYEATKNPDISFHQLAKLVDKIVREFSYSKENPLPIFLLEQHQGEDNMPIALIIGEQHQGDNFKGISYARTSRTLIDFLISLYASQELALSDALKEGSSKLFYSDEYQNYSKDDFAMQGHHPLEAILHLLKATKPHLNVYASEPLSAILKFIIYAVLYNSLITESVIPVKENDRILKILMRDCDDLKIELIDLLVEQVIDELNLQPLINQRVIIRSPISSLYKLMNIDLDKSLEAAAERIRIPRLYATLEAKRYPESEFITTKIRIKTQQWSEVRDEFIANEFLKFRSGVHPIVIGHKHLRSLTKLLRERGCSVFAMSTFRE